MGESSAAPHYAAAPQRNWLSSRQSGPNVRSIDAWRFAQSATRRLQPSTPPALVSTASMALPLYMYYMKPPLLRPLYLSSPLR